MLVDIAAIPVELVVGEAVRLNRVLARLADDDIELGGGKVPHVSLLIIDVEERRVDELKTAVLGTFGAWPADLLYGPLSQEKKTLRVFWNAVGDGWRKLHDRALEFGEQYHTSDSEELWMGKADRFTQRQIGYVRRYGTPYVCEFFKPHITLARLSCTVDLSEIAVPENCRGIDRIGLFALDDKYRAVREI